MFKKIDWKTVIISAVVAVIAVSLFKPSATTQKESTYDRVMRTKTIRCGYIVWPPFMNKNPNTNKYSGMNFDVINEMAKTLNVNIEWTEEIALGQSVTALESGRIDMVCAGDGPMQTDLFKYIDFSNPIANVPIYAYGRLKDERINKISEKKEFNSDQFSYSVFDGDISMFLAKEFAPNASKIELSQTADPKMLFTNVEKGKADIVFADAISFKGYNTSNPNKLKKIKINKPLKLIPNAFSIKKNEKEFLTLINDSLESISKNGKLENILKKYDSSGKVLIPVKKKYKE